VQTTHLIFVTITSIKSETAELQKKQPCDCDTMLSHVNKPAFLMNWGLSTTQMVVQTQF